MEQIPRKIGAGEVVSVGKGANSVCVLLSVGTPTYPKPETQPTHSVRSDSHRGSHRAEKGVSRFLYFISEFLLR